MCLTSVYLTEPHARDQISQAFPLCICILQAIKYWRWERPGNEATNSEYQATLRGGSGLGTRLANMACISTDLDALSYALQRLGIPNMILKPEQRSVIESICNGKDTFVWLPTDRVWEVNMLPDSSVCV